MDRAVCQGHARCVDVAPEFFDIDDEDRAVVVNDKVLGASLRIAQAAAASCPEGAITITGDSA